MNFLKPLNKKFNKNFIYLVDGVRVNRVVEAGVEIVEKIDHLKGRRARGYCRETDNVREINRDLAKFFGIDGHSELQLFGDRAENIEHQVRRFISDEQIATTFFVYRHFSFPFF